MSRLIVDDTEMCEELDRKATRQVKGGFSFGQWFMNQYKKARKKADSGTVKAGDYEVGVGDTGPSDADLLSGIGGGGRTPRTPPIE